MNWMWITMNIYCFAPIFIKPVFSLFTSLLNLLSHIFHSKTNIHYNQCYQIEWVIWISQKDAQVIGLNQSECIWMKEMRNLNESLETYNKSDESFLWMNELNPSDRLLNKHFKQVITFIFKSFNSKSREELFCVLESVALLWYKIQIYNSFFVIN